MKKKENRENSLSEGRALEDYFTEKGLRTSTGLPKNAGTLFCLKSF
jgi:hypothetical protein